MNFLYLFVFISKVIEYSRTGTNRETGKIFYFWMMKKIKNNLNENY